MGYYTGPHETHLKDCACDLRKLLPGKLQQPHHKWICPVNPGWWFHIFFNHIWDDWLRWRANIFYYLFFSYGSKPTSTQSYILHYIYIYTYIFQYTKEWIKKWSDREREGDIYIYTIYQPARPRKSFFSQQPMVGPSEAWNLRATICWPEPDGNPRRSDSWHPRSSPSIENVA
jgi:hypothetical protein